MDETGVEGEVAQGIGRVVDGVLWVNEVAVGQTHHGACSPNLPLLDNLAPPYPAAGGGLEVCGKPGDGVACIGADWWRRRGITVKDGESGWVTTWVGAEVGGFVHIDPKSIDIYAIRWTEEAGEFAVPIALGVGIEPVREGGDTRPDDA